MRILTVKGLVLTGGGAGGGGAVPGGDVTIINSMVIGNVAGSGGGISAVSVELTNTTVSDNHADLVSGQGGGILADTVNLFNSTVSGNSAGEGGGIKSFGVTLVNSTVTGNSAGFDGAGVFATTATLINSTVTGNKAVDNAGGIDASATINLTNSIVFGNSALSQIETSATPTLTGGNILGGTYSVGGVTQQTGITLADVFASVSNNPDTGVASGTLADNGGRVQTVMILRGGIADNAGDNALPTEATLGIDINGDGDQDDTIDTDARGFARLVDGTVDIGAVEIQPPIITSNGGGDTATVNVQEIPPR